MPPSLLQSPFTRTTRARASYLLHQLLFNTEHVNHVPIRVVPFETMSHCVVQAGLELLGSQPRRPMGLFVCLLAKLSFLGGKTPSFPCAFPGRLGRQVMNNG